MALEKYVDKLPIPPVLTPVSTDDGVDYYEVTMRQITQKLHRDLAPTTLYAYNGIYPGPTIVAESNKPIKVKWMNDLPVNPHLLPVDKTLHGAEGPYEVRTVVHLHGANVQPNSDGFPEAWFTNNFEHVGPAFTNEVYYYPNKQPATTLFYHDHAIGITRLNVYAGLAAGYLIRDEVEESLNLPKGEFEIPLIIQDRTFDPNVNGALFYPSQPDVVTPKTPNPSVVPEFFGDTILVNGMVWPYLEVRPQRYRFRLVNGSNSRFYNISLQSIVPNASPMPIWKQIGTDGGFLEAPVLLTSLTLAPGERADTIIDFTGCTGSFEFTNDATAPFPNGDSPDENTSKIMRFDVVLPLAEDGSEIPTSLTTINWLNPDDASKTRYPKLIEKMDPQYDRLILLLDDLMWDDPIIQKPRLNTIEVWALVNTTMDTHPIHLHLVQFQILGRRPFSMSEYNSTGKIVYTGPEVEPDDNEKGWKDTVRANPEEVTRIIARFGDFTGVYPWHCHILEHEDNEMMRPYEVVRKHAK